MRQASWAEVISYSSNKIHQTWRTDFIRFLYFAQSYLALLDVVVGDDGVLVPDGVELVHEDVLEVAQLHVDAVEPLPPPRHRPQARLVPGNVPQVQRVQHLQSRETITEGYF